MRTVCIVIYLGLIGPGAVLAQERGAHSYNMRGAWVDTLDASEEQPYALRRHVIRGSVTIRYDGLPVDSSRYRLDALGGRLWVDLPTGRAGDLLVVTYRTLPFRLEAVYTQNPTSDTLSIDTTTAASADPGTDSDPPDPGSPDFSDVDIRRSGSISRSIITGNRQDLAVESGLRMQLAGNISEDVRIEAVLSDQNTPIQPDGTTQRLNDLDRVFINMQTPFGAATMGDFQYSMGTNTFAAFSRKLQGASARTSFSDVGRAGAGGHVSMAGAVSRGTYRFQEIEPVDGLQGPYRLTGKHGEPFIIVIAGSETVYLDGEPLTRGSSNGYIIDYATGELTFTSEHLITSDSRIAVEFEYTTNRYTRTMLAGETKLRLWPRDDGTSRARMGVRTIREADNRFLGGEAGFSTEDSTIIAHAGDAPAVSSGARRVAFDPESPYVQYTRRDTVYGESTYSIYAPVRSRTDSVYRVQFTRVSDDSASYRRSTGVVNGIAYEWAGPGNGDYEPVRVLSKPQRKRLVDMTAAVEPVDGLELFGEWAQSLNDQNRLSELDAADDRGGAYHVGIRIDSMDIEAGSRSLGQIGARVSRRRVGASFETFGRTRAIEFGRRWNLAREVSSTGAAVAGSREVETDASLDWSPVQGVRLGAGWGALELGSRFRGQRRTLTLESARAPWPRIDYELAYVTSRDSVIGQHGRWIQQTGTVRQPLAERRLTPFVSFEHERRVQHVMGTNRLAANSVAYREWRPGVEWSDGSLSATGSIEYRTEERPEGSGLGDAGHAWTGRARLDYRGGVQFQTGADLIYRAADYADLARPIRQSPDGTSVVLRWNTRWQPLDRAVRLNGMYEAMTRRSPILQETYVRTGVELGEFVWEDANDDEIRQVDEFIPERTPYEGTYAKTFVPSDELVPAIKGHARINLRFEPDRWWTEASSLLSRTLRVVTSQTTIDILEESTTPRFSNVYLFRLNTFRNRDRTVNGRLRLGQRIDLFRDRSGYGASIAYNGLRSLHRRAAGYEQQERDRWTLNGRMRPAEKVGTRLELEREHNRSLAQRFGSRSYDIRGWSAAPEISWQVTRGLQTTLGLHVSEKTDTGVQVNDRRTARIFRIPLTFRYSRQQRWMISGRLERSDVRMKGTAMGMAAYQLTDGRGLGTSYLWSGTARYSINRFLNASLIYDGRIPGDAPPVHTVRMEMSATF